MAVPVTIEDARQQLRLEDDWSQDVELQGFIADAAAWVERYTGHILEARDVTEQIRWSDRLFIQAWPIKPEAVPVVAYSGAAGSIGLPGVRLDLSQRPARLLPAIGTAWPRDVAGTPVTVTVRAGYEAGASPPGNFRRAMLLLIGAYDADREGGEILAKAEATARLLCRDFRVRRL